MVIETGSHTRGLRDEHDDTAARDKPSDAAPRQPEKDESPLDYLPTSDSVQPDVDASDVIY